MDLLAQVEFFPIGIVFEIDCIFERKEFGNSKDHKVVLSFLSLLCEKSLTKNPFSFNFQSLRPTQNLINQISKSLNCSQIEEAALSIALTNSSNPDIARFAEQHLKICLPNLIQSYIELGESFDFKFIEMYLTLLLFQILGQIKKGH